MTNRKRTRARRRQRQVESSLYGVTTGGRTVEQWVDDMAKASESLRMMHGYGPFPVPRLFPTEDLPPGVILAISSTAEREILSTVVLDNLGDPGEES